MNQQNLQDNQGTPLPPWLDKIRTLVQNQQNHQETQQPAAQTVPQRTSWAAPPVKFTEAVIICLLQKFSDVSGRASRSEFWLFTAAYCAILAIPVIGQIAGLPLIIPLCAAAVRRLHDTGRSGWWLLPILLGFICIPIASFKLWFVIISSDSLIGRGIALGIIAMWCKVAFSLIQKGQDQRNYFDGDIPPLSSP